MGGRFRGWRARAELSGQRGTILLGNSAAVQDKPDYLPRLMENDPASSYLALVNDMEQ